MNQVFTVFQSGSADFPYMQSVVFLFVFVLWYRHLIYHSNRLEKRTESSFQRDDMAEFAG